MVLGLSAAPASAAHATLPQEQSGGTSWPGNLLSMNNADFENGVGDWVASNDAKPLTTEGSTVFLHNEALEIDATGPGTSIINLSGAGIDLPGTGSARTFRVGAYINMQSADSHTAEFDLQCYDASGDPIAWEYGSPVSLTSDGNWHWVEDDISVPADCASVQDSPQIQVTNMHAGGTIYMDEAWFAPKRAALMIGAVAADASTWQTNNTTIGPLQSDKFFWSDGQDFSTWTATNPPNGCSAIEQKYINSPSQWPVCLIAFKDPETYSQIYGFLQGMPTQQTVIFIYHQEPEGDTFGPGPCQSGATGVTEFQCEFAQEATNIRQAANQLGLTENVFIADDASSGQYDTPDSDDGNGDAGMSPTPCAWITPPSDTDFYFVDHYERGWANGTNLAQQTGSSSQNGYDGDGTEQWNNWLGCVDTYANTLDKPIGVAEYGLCSGGAGALICSQTQGCGGIGDGGSTADDMNTLKADRTYLANQPSGTTPQPWSTSPTLLWEYWYENCWLFNDSSGMTEWQSIEDQNGGAVEG